MKKTISVLAMGVLVCLIILPNIRPEAMIENRGETVNSGYPLSSCETMKIVAERKKQNSQTLKIGIESDPVFPRPPDPGGGIDGAQHLLPELYNTTYFMIHWTNGTDGGNTTDAVPLEDSNSNGIPNYIENLGSVFENVWNFEIGNQGFQVPPNDTARPNDIYNANPDGRYDVFVYDLGFFYSGYTDPEQPNSPLTSYSYIGIQNDEILEGMQVIAAHEFFHAIQFGYNRNADSWWMETSAVYMENVAYPAVNASYYWLPLWFNTCDMYGLETYDWENVTEFQHAYGNFIFAKRLQEDFGNEIIKSIWEQMRTSNYALVAINNTLINRNSSLVSEFGRFIESNFFLEQMYQNGTGYRNALKYTDYNGVRIKYQYNASTAGNSTEINYNNTDGPAWMDKWATDYITMKLDPKIPNYRISFYGLDNTTNYLVELATKKDGLINNASIFSLNSQKQGSLDLTYDTFENVTLIIANAGNTSTSNPSWKVVISNNTIYDLAVTNVESSVSVASPGQTINITVTVKNNGNTPSDAFNVSVYWNDSLIELKSISNLFSGESENLTISWSIPLNVEGTARIWAKVSTIKPDCVPENNEFQGQPILIVSNNDQNSLGGGRIPCPC